MIQFCLLCPASVVVDWQGSLQTNNYSDMTSWFLIVTISNIQRELVQIWSVIVNASIVINIIDVTTREA